MTVRELKEVIEELKRNKKILETIIANLEYDCYKKSFEERANIPANHDLIGMYCRNAIRGYLT